MCAAINRYEPISDMTIYQPIRDKYLIHLCRSLDSGVRLTDPKYFVNIDKEALGELLKGDNDVPIPLLQQRLECLHEVGENINQSELSEPINYL